MADVTRVQIDPHRRRAGGGHLHEGRGLRWVERAGVDGASRPYGVDRQHVRQIERVDHRPADVLNAVPGQRAEVGFRGVDRLDPG